MPLRSLRWIRPSAGASWARADGATAAVAVAAAGGGLMNARRLISYGAVITLPLELDDSRLVAASYHASWTGASRQSSPPSARGLVIRASVRGINRSQFRFTAGSTAGQRSLIALDAPETADTITDTGFVLDPLISPAAAAITMVPEPPTVTLLGIGALSLIVCVRSSWTVTVSTITLIWQGL